MLATAAQVASLQNFHLAILDYQWSVPSETTYVPVSNNLNSRFADEASIVRCIST